MKRLLFAGILLLMTRVALAQKGDKDTLIYNLPVVNGRLIYEGSGKVNGRDRATLDSTAKQWFYGFFKLNHLSDENPAVVFSDSDTSTVMLNRGFLEYSVRPGMVNISFVAIIRIKVTCADNTYGYKIDNIFFRPKNGTLNALGYQNNPQYLIEVYKRKHIGFWTSMNVTRAQIRDYLSNMNAAIRDCIASLNKAMAN